MAHTINLPRISVCGITYRDGKLLMGTRNKEPNFGKWVIPGGKIEPFEAIETALKREMLEEVGLKVTPTHFVGLTEIINSPTEHRIILLYQVSLDDLSARPVAGDDLGSVAWFSRDELTNLIRADKMSSPIARALKRWKMV